MLGNHVSPSNSTISDRNSAVWPVFDLAVVGAGPAGLVTGLAAAKLGLETVIVGPRASAEDGRSVALFEGAVQLLRNLGVWDAIAAATAPLDGIRLVDATGALFRAPEVTFKAREIGFDAFGTSVPTAVLTSALEHAVARAANPRRITSAVTGYDLRAAHATLTTADGEQLSARLIAAADGRASPARTAAGIACKTWAYPQTAIVTTFAHSIPHKRISTEFHRRSGPLTVVPGPDVSRGDNTSPSAGRSSGRSSGPSSSLVWVETPENARRIAGLDDAAFLAELAGHLGGLLGRLFDVAPRRAFPLSGQTAESLGRNRVALVGEAAHVMPPIGAQGLNLSFRDAATLAAAAADGLQTTGDCGADAVLMAYSAARSRDVTSRVWTIDLLNRSLLSPYLPVHLARGAGMYAMSLVGPLRRSLMREGMMPDHALPALMRP